MAEDFEHQLGVVRGWIAASRRLVVLTGAGISTESGIPDFRGPQGVWTRNPEAEKQSTIQHYVADTCLLYTSPSPRDGLLSRMPSSA